MQNLTLISLAWELYLEGIPKSHLAPRLGKNRETIHLWIEGVRSHRQGLLGYLESYQTAKRGPRAKRKIDARVKRFIWDYREEYHDICGQKIAHFLNEDRGIKLSPTTIYEVLSEKYQLRSKWKKNHSRGVTPEATKPRAVIQMDSVDFGEVYAFTGVDIFTKEVSVGLATELTADEGAHFLQESMEKRFDQFTDILQTDGGPEFKSGFHDLTPSYTNWHRIARPYRKNEQSYIESFNRSLRKECWGWTKYQLDDLARMKTDLTNYLDYYHNKRPHLSLNMKTPNEFLEGYKVSDI